MFRPALKRCVLCNQESRQFLLCSISQIPICEIVFGVLSVLRLPLIIISCINSRNFMVTSHVMFIP